MSPDIKAALLDARATAEAAMARLPAALAQEAATARAEKRKPNPVQPLTEVEADHVAAALAEIKGQVSSAAADVIKVYAVSMARAAGKAVSVRSDHLLLVLDAAGVDDAA